MPLTWPPGAALWAILPELFLLTTLCVVLIVPVLPPFQAACRRSHKTILYIALLGLLGAAVSTLSLLSGTISGSIPPDGYLFSGMLSIDRYALTFKLILYVFTALVLALWTVITQRHIRSVDGPDYVSLIIGAVLGMSLMASATNLLMIYLAIEAASFPSFALAGFYKTTRRGSEASMKYVLMGVSSSAIMLYGLSMLYGSYGTLDLSLVAQQVAEQGGSIGLLIGMLGLLVGIGFKLSIVPMHFWCPDVFEGAPFEISTFLSVASKGAAIVLLVRIMMTFGYYVPLPVDGSNPNHLPGALHILSITVGIIGLITATWGNLAAYFQTNMKRLLAYSSIAHAGYMTMAAALLSDSIGGITTYPSGVALHGELAGVILFYVLVYMFMNFGAFTVAAIVERSTGSEQIKDYSGLIYRSPALAVVMCVFLMSLFGMPVTGGFWAKVYIGFQMWEENMWWLVIGLVVNTVFSLYLYLKPLISMIFKPAVDRQPFPAVSMAAWLLLLIATLGVFATGIIPDQFAGWTKDNAVLNYRSAPTTIENIEVKAP